MRSAGAITPRRLRADAIRSPAECAPRQAFLFEKHTDDDRSCDDKGGLGYRPGLPVPSDAKEHVPDPSQSEDRKSTRLNSSHDQISYAVFCLKKKKTKKNSQRQQSKTPKKARTK